MEPASERSKAIQILEFWHKIEFFVPYDLGQVLDGVNESYWLSREELASPLPEHLFWLQPCIATSPVQYFLYLGLFSTESIDEVCAQLGLAEADNWRTLENRERGFEQTCCARVSLGPDGRVNWNRFSVSSLPWALGRLRAGGVAQLSSRAFREARRDLEFRLANFANRLKRVTDSAGERQSLGRPLAGSDILTIADLLFDWAGYTPDHKFVALLEVQPLTNTHKSATPEPYSDDEEEESKLPGVDILNSFYLEDLEEAIEAIEADASNRHLTRYLGIESDPEAPADGPLDVYSSEGEAAIRRLVEPRFISSGRWLDAPERQMTLMQQFAINAAREALADGGMYSVNGPPGTGKTTMLRELIADNLVRRACALAQFASPQQAFTGTIPVSFTGQQPTYHAAVLHPSLTGYEMVVASSNNTAVENISKDLPLPRSRHDAWNDVDYLRPVAQKAGAAHRNGRVIPLEEGCRPWGLIAGVLGNSRNRRKFVQRVFFGPENPAGNAEEANAGDYLNLRDWADAYNGPNFRTSVAKFKEAASRVQQYSAELQRYAELYATIHNVSEDSYCDEFLATLHSAEDEHDAALRQVASSKTHVDELSETLRRLEREEALLEELRPRWYQIVLSGPSNLRKYQLDLRQNREAQVDVSSRLRKAQEQHSSCSAHSQAAEQRVKTARVESEKKRHEFRAIKEELAALNAKFDVHPCPLRPESLDDKKYQEKAFWQDQHLSRMRSELFAAALQVHESWLAAVIKPGGGFRPNTVAISKLLGGAVPSKAEHILPIWQSLFMIVPVVSSTFASFHRQFSGVPPQALGWLLIDEAGQAVPQAAVGALRKARRVLVVGDPMQIEPIFGIPIRLIEHLAGDDAQLIQTYSPHLVSVQTVADRMNRHGARIERDESTIWIGCPLRIHWRCASPMFKVANQIAYEGRMLQGRPESKTAALHEDSCWFHVPGRCSDAQYVTEQGDFVLRSIIRLFIETGQLPNVYLIAPFRRIAQRLRILLVDQEQWLAALPPEIAPPARRALWDWARTRIGTVHTFQGKEEEAVFFVLGADQDSPGSARWAASKPNLLNVALTRAKDRIYLVGDRRLWGNLRHFEKIARELTVIEVSASARRSVAIRAVGAPR